MYVFNPERVACVVAGVVVPAGEHAEVKDSPQARRYLDAGRLLDAEPAADDDDVTGAATVADTDRPARATATPKKEEGR